MTRNDRLREIALSLSIQARSANMGGFAEAPKVTTDRAETYLAFLCPPTKQRKKAKRS